MTRHHRELIDPYLIGGRRSSPPVFHCAVVELVTDACLTFIRDSIVVAILAGAIRDVAGIGYSIAVAIRQFTRIDDIIAVAIRKNGENVHGACGVGEVLIERRSDECTLPGNPDARPNLLASCGAPRITRDKLGLVDPVRAIETE